MKRPAERPRLQRNGGPAPEGRRGPSSADIALGLSIVAAVFAAFWPALDGEFLAWDDNELVVQNQDFRGLAGRQLEWMLRTGHMGHYHPLSWLSLALDSVLWGSDAGGRLAPAGFHLTNLVLHSLTALLVFALARRLMALGGGEPSPWSSIAAAFAALLFAVHPLRVESVAWITERRDVLSAPLFLACVLAWLSWGRALPAARLRTGRLIAAAACAAAAVGLALLALDFSCPGWIGAGPAGLAGLGAAVALWAASVLVIARSAEPAARRWMVSSALLLLASLLAKAWGMVMPALLLLLDAWPLGRARGERAPFGAWMRLTLEKAPFVSLSVVFGVLAGWAQGTRAETLVTLSDHTLAERVAQGFYGLAFYPLRTLFPVGLAPIYELPQHLSFSETRFLVPLFSVLGISAAVLVLRRRAPAALVAWIAFGLIVSPVLGVLQSGEQLVADRYAYISCIPFALLGGLALQAVLDGSVAGLRSPAARRGALVAAALWILTLGGLSHMQSTNWTSTERLWTSALEEVPDSYVIHAGLGSEYYRQAGAARDLATRRQLLQQSIRWYESAANLRPRPYYSISAADACLKLAQLEPRDVATLLPRAGEHCANALAQARQESSTRPEYLLGLGKLFYELGDALRAEEAFGLYTRAFPDRSVGWTSLAAMQIANSRLAECIVSSQRAVALAPSDRVAWWNLGTAQERLGNLGEACEAYARVLALDPAHSGAGAALARLGCQRR